MSIPASGRCPEEGSNNPLQDSFLGNLMDRGAWRAIVCGVARQSDTPEWLNNSNNTVSFCLLFSNNWILLMWLQLISGLLSTLNKVLSFFISFFSACISFSPFISVSPLIFLSLSFTHNTLGRINNIYIYILIQRLYYAKTKVLGWKSKKKGILCSIFLCLCVSLYKSFLCSLQFPYVENRGSWVWWDLKSFLFLNLFWACFPWNTSNYYLTVTHPTEKCLSPLNLGPENWQRITLIVSI